MKFLGVHITDDLKWSTQTDSVVKNVQQRLVIKTLTNLYRCPIESILSSCINVWYGNCVAHNRRAHQRVVQSAQRITGGKLPAVHETYSNR